VEILFAFIIALPPRARVPRARSSAQAPLPH
jgi:hypothetical protein